jgi:hypothetical protein
LTWISATKTARKALGGWKNFSVPCARESRGVFAGDDWWLGEDKHRLLSLGRVHFQATFAEKPRTLGVSGQWLSQVVEGGSGSWMMGVEHDRYSIQSGFLLLESNGQ